MLGVPRASENLRRFHYDLAMRDPKLTRILIDLMGGDREFRPRGAGRIRHRQPLPPQVDAKIS